MDFKHKYELETGNSIYDGNGQMLPSGTYSDEFVDYLLKQLSIYSVVSSKITVSVTYLKWHDSGHALLDDYSTKETKIVKVNDIEQVNEMFTNVIKIKVVK